MIDQIVSQIKSMPLKDGHLDADCDVEVLDEGIVEIGRPEPSFIQAYGTGCVVICACHNVCPCPGHSKCKDK